MNETTHHNKESNWEQKAREIVYILATKEDEVRKMGFPSFLLEALEKSITDLALSVAQETRGEILEELIDKIYDAHDSCIRQECCVEKTANLLTSLTAPTDEN